MQLFYTPNIALPLYELPEEESAHSVRVLRLSRGDMIHMTDGRGNLYRAEIVTADPKRTTVRVVETVPRFEKRDYSLTVAVAPTKNIDRLEWFLEKATETGIDRIIPIECDHSERRTINRDRQLRVITSAVKQSLKAYHPVLDGMTPLRDVIAWASGDGFTGKKLIAHCRGEGSVGTHEDVCAEAGNRCVETGSRRRFIGDVLSRGDDALILIGPEGDFSEKEIAAALAAGFIPVTLGTSRLRTETAALAAVTIAAFVNNAC